MGKASRYMGINENKRNSEIRSNIRTANTPTSYLKQSISGALTQTSQTHLKTDGGIMQGPQGFMADVIKINASGVLDLSLNDAGKTVKIRGDIYILPNTGNTDTLNRIEANGTEFIGQRLLLRGDTGKTITITHGLSVIPDVAATGSATCVSVGAGDTFSVNGLTYTAVTGAKANNTEFSVDTSDNACATDLADSITNDARTGIDEPTVDQTASAGTNVVNIIADTVGSIGNNITMAETGGNITLSGATLTGGTDNSGTKRGINCPNDADYTLKDDNTVHLAWDALALRWAVIGDDGGGGAGGGAGLPHLDGYDGVTPSWQDIIASTTDPSKVFQMQLNNLFSGQPVRWMFGQTGGDTTPVVITTNFSGLTGAHEIYTNQNNTFWRGETHSINNKVTLGKDEGVYTGWVKFANGVESDIFPLTDDRWDLGSSTLVWENAHIAFTKDTFFRARDFIPSTTNGAPLNTMEQATNKQMIETLDFDSTTPESAQILWSPGNNWNPTKTDNQLQIRLFWTTQGGAPGDNIDFDIFAISLDDNDAIDTAWTAITNITDVRLANNDMHITAWTSPFSVQNTPVQGNTILFKLQRDPVSDSLGVDCQILGMEVRHTVYDLGTTVRV